MQSRMGRDFTTGRKGSGFYEKPSGRQVAIVKNKPTQTTTRQTTKSQSVFFRGKKERLLLRTKKPVAKVQKGQVVS